MWLSYLKIKPKFLPSPLLNFPFPSWFYNCLSFILRTLDEPLIFPALLSYSALSPGNFFPQETLRLGLYISTTTPEQAAISSVTHWQGTLTCLLASSQTSLPTRITQNANWSQIISLSFPCSPPPTQVFQYLLFTTFPESPDSTKPESSLIFILLFPTSPLWFFTIPRMPLVLSLLCILVLADLLS